MKLWQLAVAQLCYLVKVIISFLDLYLFVYIFNFLTQLLYALYSGLFIFPLCLKGVKLVAQLGKLLPYALQLFCGKLVVLFFKGGLLNFKLHYFS